MNIWDISLILSVAFLLVLFFDIIKKIGKTNKKQIVPLFVGRAIYVILSAVCWLFPAYLKDSTLPNAILRLIDALLHSLQHTIRLFAGDDGYHEIIAILHPEDAEVVVEVFAFPSLEAVYCIIGQCLFLIAPVFTFLFIASFFKNLLSYLKYKIRFDRNAHVFSELNEKSLALAKSIYKTSTEEDADFEEEITKSGSKHEKKESKWKEGKKKTKRMHSKKVSIVFADIIDKNEEAHLDLIEGAKEIGAILFRRDLNLINFNNWPIFSRKKRKLSFYLISNDEEEKIRHAESIMRDYDISDKIELRLFSDDIRSELLLASQKVQHMKVIRVNDIQSLIYHNIDVHGDRLFNGARSLESGDKVISAVIVGLGKYGLEMMKALTWFCQLPGYRIKINAFDIDSHAEEKFTCMCPELMSEKYNGQDIPGETRYEINIHDKIDTNSPAFFDALTKIKDATYIFVCLGNDEVNLETAIKIRALCERIRYVGDHHKPDIETVIYDSNIRNTMGLKWSVTGNVPTPQGVVNFKGQGYDIHMIGDLEHFYCVDTLVDSELVNEGKLVHLRWGPESDFWKFEYNYRSSIAKAIHERLRVKLGLHIPGIHKKWEDRTNEEKLAIGLIEHIRWNAYMRTEGYQYSGSKNKTSRNDLGKIHNNLVPVTELSDDDLRKDA